MAFVSGGMKGVQKMDPQDILTKSKGHPHLDVAFVCVGMKGVQKMDPQDILTKSEGHPHLDALQLTSLPLKR